MTKYTAEQVIAAADQLRTVMDIRRFELREEDDGSMSLTNGMFLEIPVRIAHELIGMGWVAIAGTRNGSWMWAASSEEHGIAYQAEPYSPPEIVGVGPTPLAAIVAACVEVLPRKDEQ